MFLPLQMLMTNPRVQRAQRTDDDRTGTTVHRDPERVH